MFLHVTLFQTQVIKRCKSQIRSNISYESIPVNSMREKKLIMEAYRTPSMGFLILLISLLSSFHCFTYVNINWQCRLIVSGLRFYTFRFKNYASITDIEDELEESIQTKADAVNYCSKGCLDLEEFDYPGFNSLHATSSHLSQVRGTRKTAQSCAFMQKKEFKSLFPKIKLDQI